VFYRFCSLFGPALFAAGLILTVRWGFLIPEFKNFLYSAGWFSMASLLLMVILHLMCMKPKLGEILSVDTQLWFPICISGIFVIVSIWLLCQTFLSASGTHYASTAEQQELLRSVWMLVTGSGLWFTIYGQLGLEPRSIWAWQTKR